MTVYLAWTVSAVIVGVLVSVLLLVIAGHKSDGRQIDHSHHWVTVRGAHVKSASVRDTYEHYHGSGSYEKLQNRKRTGCLICCAPLVIAVLLLGPAFLVRERAWAAADNFLNGHMGQFWPVLLVTAITLYILGRGAMIVLRVGISASAWMFPGNRSGGEKKDEPILFPLVLAGLLYLYALLFAAGVFWQGLREIPPAGGYLDFFRNTCPYVALVYGLTSF